jgi:NADH-quinone oxidoreductase subunit L
MPEGAHGELFMEWFLMALTLTLAVCGIVAARHFYITHTAHAASWAARFRGVKRILANNYYVDQIYDALFVKPVVLLGRLCWQVGDVFAIDGIAHGLADFARLLGKSGARLQSGLVRSYLLVFALGVVLALAYYALAWTR